MAAPINPNTLSFALRNAWDELGHTLFDQEKTDEVTGEQVRQFIRRYLDGESPATNPNIHKFWRALSDEQKDQALAAAFPDQTYRRSAD